MSFKILFPVDGSDNSLRVARYLAGLAGLMKSLEVFMINVESAGDDWRVKRVLKPEELASMEAEWGEAAMAPSRAILKSAGIAFNERIVQGDVPETIVRLAKELGCDQIVMGTRGQSSIGGLLMGSVTTKVLHIADVPVTLVK
jgi:nucleotide-binding universal stress UspA family protein